MQENNAKDVKKKIWVSLTAKNQLTLPVEAQEYLGTTPKSQIELVLENGKAYIKPAPMTIEDVRASVKPKAPLTVGWKEAEDIAKDEHAQHVIDEMKRQ